MSLSGQPTTLSLTRNPGSNQARGGNTSSTSASISVVDMRHLVHHTGVEQYNTPSASAKAYNEVTVKHVLVRGK